MNTNTFTLAEKLRALRRQAGITQEQAAGHCGISLRSYKSYELNQTRPRYDEIYERLATLYNVPADYLRYDHITQAGLPEAKDADAKQLIAAARALFAGAHLTDADRDAIFLALTDAYKNADGKKHQ
ncbi:MAG: helix-turn-helix transcriptional regulator [Eubacteriales bacterium]|nr:helix-turn-helix transcriptional regulator [Eubacteriales bacterium]